MSTTIVMLFVTALVLEVSGQIFFKVGAERLPAFDGPDQKVFYRSLLTDGWLLAGVAAYVGQLLVWLQILSVVPISVAFPIASANFLGVTLAGRVFLGERVTQQQWLGAALVTCGVAVVAGLA